MTPRVPRGTPEGGQFAEGRKPEGTELRPAVRLATMPENVGGYGFNHAGALKVLGTRNVLAISGGRVLIISDETRKPVGMALPVSQGYSVHIYLTNEDDYTVQRIFRGKIKGEVEGVLDESLAQVSLDASAYASKDFGDFGD